MSDQRPIGVSKRAWEEARAYNRSIVARLAHTERNTKWLWVVVGLNTAANVLHTIRVGF